MQLGGSTTTVPAGYLAGGGLDHGYALTVHQSQGMTCEHAMLLGSDALYREAGYVGLSRGRQRNDLHLVDRPADDDPAREDCHAPRRPSRRSRTRSPQCARRSRAAEPKHSPWTSAADPPRPDEVASVRRQVVAAPRTDSKAHQCPDAWATSAKARRGSATSLAIRLWAASAVNGGAVRPASSRRDSAWLSQSARALRLGRVALLAAQPTSGPPCWEALVLRRSESKGHANPVRLCPQRPAGAGGRSRRRLPDRVPPRWRGFIIVPALVLTLKYAGGTASTGRSSSVPPRRHRRLQRRQAGRRPCERVAPHPRLRPPPASRCRLRSAPGGARQRVAPHISGAVADSASAKLRR